MDIKLGLKVGYSLTRKSSTLVERFPNESVLVMEETPEPVKNKDGKMSKVTRKFTMSTDALKTLGLLGKAYQKTDEFPHELLHTAHFVNEDKSTTYLLLNTTEADADIRGASFRATQSGGFSNKPLHEVLVEGFDLDSNAEALFSLKPYVIESMESIPAVLIELRAEDFIDGGAPVDEKSKEAVEMSDAIEGKSKKQAATA